MGLELSRSVESVLMRVSSQMLVSPIASGLGTPPPE